MSSDSHGDAVSIGAAAALFGLRPSTLRWWEAQGVLPAPGRRGDRRRYDRRELRRIGLAHLCCVTGAMPLSRAAAVCSGDVDHATWQGEVTAQIERLDRDIERLDAARDQLRHLQQCTDDDPVADCPYLEAVLVEHTPRGRVGEGDLLAAAHTAGASRRGPQPGGRGLPDGARRDETSSIRHGDPADRRAHCAQCAAELPAAGAGRPRTYCSRGCRQRAYRIRAGRHGVA